ncbi:tyrosine-protein kinase Dnt-like [Hetaerina americana]|uniref:tyrosine-protein kinase Dnt-like n=1 Tax=Hetaerina americana TaxID=62018 RepID=UPI003A7F1C75
MAATSGSAPLGTLPHRRAALPLFCLAVIAWTAVTPVCGHLNLFISQQEVKKLLGLSAELYYVRDGVVNTYAMNFVVPVPAHISDLHFSWQSLVKNPLPYVLAVDYDDRLGALRPPEFNISLRGQVPTRVQTFRVRFPCTGLRSAEIEIVMQLNVSTYNPLHNETSLNFRRNKICLKEERLLNESSAVASRPPGPGSMGGVIASAAGGGGVGAVGGAGGAFYIGVACACAMILLVASVGLASLLLLRSKKDGRNGHQDSLHTSYTTAAAYGSNPNVFIRLDSARNFGSVGRTSSVGTYVNGVGGAGSVCSGSYATIASFQKVPLGSSNAPPSPSPYYSTSVVGGQSVGGASSCGTASNHVYARPHCGSRVSYYASSQISQVSGGTLHDPRIGDPSERLRHLTVPSTSVRPRTLLHEGTFGRLYRGVFVPYRPKSGGGSQGSGGGRRGSSGGGGRYRSYGGGSTTTDVEADEEDVFVKTVTEAASALQTSLLVSEGTMLWGLSHRHLLPVLAVALPPGRPPLLAYPYASRGNLKRFLQRCRLRAGEEAESVTLMTRDIVGMGVQVALALLFLHRHRICHRDIATRNCVVDSDLRVRVTDSALSRDLFPADYHCLGDNENRPIKWLAPESLVNKRFSAASDSWAFGVLLWELTTLAQQPYSEVDPFEMAAFIRDGYRLAQPLNCPDELFAVMACCWLSAPEERPSVVQLLTCLQDFYTALGRYI